MMHVPGWRIRQGNGRFRGLPGILWKQYSCLKIFWILSGNFRPFPDGKNRKGPQFIGKNPKISGREYCFHLPVISRFFLQDTMIFPTNSRRLLQYLVSGIVVMGWRLLFRVKDSVQYFNSFLKCFSQFDVFNSFYDSKEQNNI